MPALGAVGTVLHFCGKWGAVCMTPERIKEIGEIRLGTYQINTGDMRAIIDAANYDYFYIISYAYSYGFLRGQRCEKARRRKSQKK